jgi:hypothetical protein
MRWNARRYAFYASLLLHNLHKMHNAWRSNA